MDNGGIPYGALTHEQIGVNSTSSYFEELVEEIRQLKKELNKVNKENRFISSKYDLLLMNYKFVTGQGV